MLYKLKLLPIELLFFTGGLIALFFTNVTQPQYALCPLKALSINYCPGCGLGHSLHYLMHGNLMAAWQTHHLSFFALPILLFRIYKLSNTLVLKFKLYA